MISIINEERDDAHIITIEDPMDITTNTKVPLTQRGVNLSDIAEFLRSFYGARCARTDVILVVGLRGGQWKRLSPPRKPVAVLWH